MTTEEKILKAAREEFLELGYGSARMRSIAEKAEINKGLLHYYFKSKEALLIRVFQETFHEIFGNMAKVFQSDLPLERKIELGVDAYTDFMLKHPRLPLFIITEMNRDPEQHMTRMKKAQTTPPFSFLSKAMEEARQKGEIKHSVDARSFMLNLLSLVLFPLVAKPMVMFMHQMDESAYRTMLENRKEHITQMLINDIKASS